MRQRLTYGTLPSREEFEQAFHDDLGDERYVIRNCPRVGNDSFNCTELWVEVTHAANEFTCDTCEGEWAGDWRSAEEIQADADAAGEWAAAVLLTLGIEWV
jgi:hypothetical protein